MGIKKRWNSEMSDFGKFLHTYGGKGLLLISAVGELTNMLGVMPADFVIPTWVRATVWACAAISFVAGKMTVKAASGESSTPSQN